LCQELNGLALEMTFAIRTCEQLIANGIELQPALIEYIIHPPCQYCERSGPEAPSYGPETRHLPEVVPAWGIQVEGLLRLTDRTAHRLGDSAGALIPRLVKP